MVGWMVGSAWLTTYFTSCCFSRSKRSLGSSKSLKGPYLSYTANHLEKKAWRRVPAAWKSHYRCIIGYEDRKPDACLHRHSISIASKSRQHKSNHHLERIFFFFGRPTSDGSIPVHLPNARRVYPPKPRRHDAHRPSAMMCSGIDEEKKKKEKTLTKNNANTV